MDGHRKTTRRTAAGLLLSACLVGAGPSSAQDDRAFADAVVEEAGNCPATPVQVFVMPTTGVPFTLPPDPNELTADACAFLQPMAPPRPPAPSLFRMVAIPIGTAPLQAKWERARFGSLADHPGAWAELVSQANEVTGGNPLGMVNQWVNWRVRYRDDLAGDEWASAGITLERGYGDCEDIALAKMALLAALGIPSREMYLVLLRDRRSAEHAVLAVRHEGRLYVLDNRTDAVQPAEQIDEYVPILSFSGPYVWTYGSPVN